MRRRLLAEALWLWLPILLLAAGCTEPQSTRCGNLWCPAGTTCTRDQSRCVSLVQLSACQNKQEKARCALSGVAEALCVGGACTAVICGDGVVAGDEICDDGNIRSCDGCSADCRSDESCGNQVVDCNEECDRAEENSDLPNAACRPDCRRQRCGDGVVDTESGEDCDGSASAKNSCADFGFYAGALACSAACRNDTTQCQGTCGDGLVNGTEICDAVWSTSQSCLDFGYDVGNLTCSPFCSPSFARCEQQGFQTMLISNLSPYLYGVWGAGANDVFAFGQQIILHYDGAVWSSMDLQGVELPENELNAFLGMWGSSGRDIFAVGYFGVIAHYDGTSWTRMPTSTTESLNSVWGFAANDVFAVGNAGFLLHYDGSSWLQLEPPAASRDYFRVWGSSYSDVYATHETGIDHFDGHVWSAVDGQFPSFARIWGSGPNDVFAVGEGSTILHFDGRSWSPMSQTATTMNLVHVRGTGPRDVYASGEHGTIIHYDGENWAPVPASTTREILAVWSAGPDDVFASTNLDILHFAQSGPTVRDMQTGTDQALTSVWITTPDDVTAVGVNGAIVHFDGSTWTTQRSPRDDDFGGVWGADATHKWAVGYKYGAIYQFDGADWTELEIPTTVPLTAVWGRSATDVYVVGGEGVILHFDGSSWRVEDSGVDQELGAVWGYDNGDVYVTGFYGLVLRKTNTTGWQNIFEESSTSYWAIWGPSPEHVIVAADAHTVFLDDKNYRTMPLGAGVLVNSIDGFGPNDVFGVPVGAVGLYHFDGRDWAPLRIPTSASILQDIAMSRDRGYIAAGEGLVIEIDRHCATQEHNCADRWDNDCDGLLNCSDSDCMDKPACAQGACVPRTTLACNASFVGTTSAAGNLFSIYPCSPRSELGHETFHRFDSDVTGPVTVSLEPEGQDLDLIVLGSAAAGGCDVAGACISSSSTSDDAERLTFKAVAGETYYFAVEGHDAQAFGAYMLTVACPSPQ